MTARLVHSAESLAEYPLRAISAEAVDGPYRLIEQPADMEVTPARILAPHRAGTARRMRGQPTVLCIQDGSDLNFATRPGCDGLEVVESNQTGTGTLGLHLHLTLAVTAQGLPLGVLRCEFGTPAKARGRKTRRWLDGYEDIAEAARELPPRTRVIAVMDREADCFELFDAQRRHDRVDLLVRTHHDHDLEGPGLKLFAALAEGPAAGWVEVEVAALAARQERLAVCELRFRRLTLPATSGDAAPVTLYGVHLVEREPPAGEEAAQWRLLTTVPVADLEDAAQIVSHYLQRWRVKDFFRVLEPGCRAEHLLFRTADQLPRSLAINGVIAWRLMVMALLGRHVPACAAELLFADDELAFLGDYARKFGLRGPEDSGAAVRLVAHLGGYRGGEHDPEPGHGLTWHGYDTLIHATLGHRIAVKAARRQDPVECSASCCTAAPMATEQT